MSARKFILFIILLIVKQLHSKPILEGSTQDFIKELPVNTTSTSIIDASINVVEELASNILAEFSEKMESPIQLSISNAVNPNIQIAQFA
ncbi:unnamed protein product [Allacma fusca]|uniref:Uncharacterized protein n=1 Tax=Allacma fusca TaxID=39272 RepID=A0A8J2KNZ9_9HEXA|nr:unnamed protein product [Allacma fusca]